MILGGRHISQWIQQYFTSRWLHHRASAELVVEKVATDETTTTAVLTPDGKRGLQWQALSDILDYAEAADLSQIDIGDAASAGTSTEVPRADHQHAFPAPSAGYPQAVAAASADGTATTPARSDHVHAHGSGYLPDAHHAKSHAHDGVDGSGTVSHASLSDLTTGDPHTQYRLESADHNHQSTGLQGGQLDHGAALTGLTDDDHTQYLKEKASGGLASEVPEHDHSAAAEGGTVSYADLTNRSHGASDHTDRTRRIPLTLIDEASVTPDFDVHGSFTTNRIIPHNDMADGVTTALSALTPIVLPADYVSGTVNLKFSWLCTVNTGNVAFQLQVVQFASGSTQGTDLLATGATPIAVPGTANTITTTTTALTTDPTAGSQLAVRIIRLGANAQDTAAGTVALYTAWLEYTADM